LAGRWREVKSTLAAGLFIQEARNMSDDLSREKNPLERFAVAASATLCCAHMGQEFRDYDTMGQRSRDESLRQRQENLRQHRDESLRQLGDLRTEALRFFHDRGVSVTEAGTVLERVWRACWALRDAAAEDRVLLGHGTQAREALRRFDELRELVEHTPANEQLPRSRPGRRGYSLEALQYARQLKADNPQQKSTWLRNRCLEKFSADDLPADADSFRRWLNRLRKFN
jgi:hypothetical protein